MRKLIFLFYSYFNGSYLNAAVYNKIKIFKTNEKRNKI